MTCNVQIFNILRILSQQLAFQQSCILNEEKQPATW